jgi:DNA-binding GntR family transcriptional regulator
MMTRTEVQQLREARLLLEPHLAEQAALRKTDEFLRTLKTTVDDFHRSADAADVETEGFDLYWRSDDRFHMAIAAQAGNPFLEMAYAALGGQIQRFRLFSKFGRTGARLAAPEHGAIFDAIASGDGQAAAEAMRSHVIGATRRLLGD